MTDISYHHPVRYSLVFFLCLLIGFLHQTWASEEEVLNLFIIVACIITLVISLNFKGLPLLFLISGMSYGGKSFAYTHISLYNIPFFVTEVIVVLMIVLSLAQGLVRGYLSYTRTDLNVAFTLYAILGLMALFRGLPKYGLEAVRDFAIVYYAIFYFILLGYVKEIRHLKYLLIAFLAGLIWPVYSLVVSLIYTNSPEMLYERFRYGGDALCFSMAAVLCAVLFTQQREAMKKFLALWSFGIFTTGSFYTQHRSSWFGLALALVIIYHVGLKRRMGKTGFLWYLLVPITIFLPITFYIAHISLNQIMAHLSYKLDLLHEVNALWRYQVWEIVFSRFLNHPILGIGFGSTLFEQVGVARTHDPHNSYLAILARLGLSGFLPFLYTVGFFYLRFLRFCIRLKNSQLLPYALGILGCHIIVSVFAFFNVVLEGPHHGIWFWMLMGMGMALMKIANRSESHENSYVP